MDNLDKLPVDTFSGFMVEYIKTESGKNGLLLWESKSEYKGNEAKWIVVHGFGDSGEGRAKCLEVLAHHMEHRDEQEGQKRIVEMAEDILKSKK